MKRKLSPWCKRAKCALIMQDLSVRDLADGLGFTKEYTSALLNGRQFSVEGVKKVSDFLGISDSNDGLPYLKS